MTYTRRIFLNILATYGRSIFSLVCGLFTGRWVLEALGTTSYGVFGVVGTVIGLVMVVNQMLSSSVSRYFAYAVGQAQATGNSKEAIEESRKWFNSAVAIHTIIPTVLVLIGYPLGIWAVRYYFSIPETLKATSEWVFVFAMITAYVGMMVVPFQALYTAHQFIAELTIYSLCQTASNVVFAWLLLSYPGDKLWFNAFYLMLIAIVPQILIAIRAFSVFPECQVRLRYMLDRERYKQLFSFAGWQVVGWFGLLFRFQGLTTLCNKVLGLEYNSSLNVANTVSQKTMVFSYALNGAFVPAITNAAGEGNVDLYNKLTLRSCKFGTIMCAIFIIPLCLEMHYIIHLWLKVVPPMVEQLCTLSLLTYIVERSTAGYSTAIYAHGNIKWIEIAEGLNWVVSFALGYLFVCVLDWGVLGIAAAIFICTATCSLIRLLFAKYLLKMRLLPWLNGFAIPFIVTSIGTFAIGFLPRVFLQEHCGRFFLAAGLSCGIFAFMSMRFICDVTERQYLKEKMLGKIPWLRGIVG